MGVPGQNCTDGLHNGDSYLLRLCRQQVDGKLPAHMFLKAC